MKCVTKKLRSPVKWHGGKSYLARRIIALFPPHRVYIEPFFGGGSILLNKPKSEVEIAGDANYGLMRFWWTIRDNFDRLLKLLNDIQYNEHVFDLAGQKYFHQMDPKIGHAVDFLVRNRFSRGGLGESFAWSDRLRGGQPGDVNAWETIKGELSAVAERVEEIRFYSGSYGGTIKAGDAPDALIYCDPPYLHETRTARKAYGQYEMSPDDHRSLLATLLRCKGKVFLSGYRSELYDFALTSGGWTLHQFDMPNHSGQGKSKQRRIECLWESP